MMPILNSLQLVEGGLKGENKDKIEAGKKKKLESDEESIDLIYLAILSGSCQAVRTNLQTRGGLESRLNSIISRKIKTAMKSGGVLCGQANV